MRGTLALLAFVLAATLVSSNEDRRREDRISEVQRAEIAAPVPPAEDLDVSPLHRTKRVEPVIDVFSPKILPAAPPVAAVHMVERPSPPPPPPEAPPLPFRYVGKFIEHGEVRLLISKGDADYHIKGGENLEDLYIVDEVSETAVTFTYLPLKKQQSMPIPAAGEETR